MKKLGAALLALVLLSGTTFAEDVLLPGKHQTAKSLSDYLRSTWSYIVRML